MQNSKDELALGEAAQWRARLSAPDCSEAERAACARWRQANAVNEAAFQQVERASTQIEQALLADRRLQALVDRALQTTPQKQKSFVARRRVPLALAASAMLATLSVWFATTWLDANDSTASASITLTAPEKSARQVALADGSIAHIDAGAKIAVSIGDRERRVEVVSGRALFEVAHDKQRPFIVSANGTQTVALGTQFEVNRTDSQTLVTLVEGSIAVTGKDGWRERLIPGEQLRVSTGKEGEHVRYSVDAATVTSWSRGWLVFRGTPLHEALREINRYSGKQVRLADVSLAGLEVAGSFIAGDSQSIVSAIAEVLPIRVVDGGSSEIILFKRYE
jgi:transmembrane sensor